METFRLFLRTIANQDAILQMVDIAIISILFIQFVIKRKFKDISKKKIVLIALISCFIFHNLYMMIIDITRYYSAFKFRTLELYTMVKCVLVEWIFTNLGYNSITDLIEYSKGDK